MSDNPFSLVASTLFVVDKDDRVHLEYPFVFVCICVGLFVRICSNFMYYKYKK